MYKLSRYVIESDFFDVTLQRKRVLIFSTRSNSMRILDDEAWNAAKAKSFSNLDSDILVDMTMNNFLVGVYA